eukprot:CAMPEP_0177653306 /NCGR_PEP_ID=MMETSP0447-20121125/13662_1 /TAXON_ID=0 /ORGANISM="Stygamoeba regulata, Strain BSH-02190019" /LENGTH=197 /DNA_ID=CAMNT_0019156747 /DNA_START=292 /DNA_END=885 /DNA_ORIENTATION=-
MKAFCFILLALVLGAVHGQMFPDSGFPLDSKVVRAAGRCVPAPDPAVCLDMPIKIGSTFRQTCERLNDPRKDDVMSGMPERCINAIEKDGADCLQAALDVACSFHCGRCESPWMARGFVRPLCPHVCNALIDACPTANNELNCFKHFDLRTNCGTKEQGHDCEYVRGDLTKIISPASTLLANVFVCLASVLAVVSML